MTTLAIAGWRIRLECASPAMTERIVARYAAFMAPDEGVCEATAVIALDGRMTGRGQPALFGKRHGGVVQFDVPEACGTIDIAAWQASLTLGAEAVLWAVEGLLKLLCAYLVLHQGGLLFHCAGLLIGWSRSICLRDGAAAASQRLFALVASGSPERRYGSDSSRGDGVWRAFGTPVLERRHDASVTDRRRPGPWPAFSGWCRTGASTWSRSLRQLLLASWWRTVRW